MRAGAFQISGAMALNELLPTVGTLVRGTEDIAVGLLGGQWKRVCVDIIMFDV